MDDEIFDRINALNQSSDGASMPVRELSFGGDDDPIVVPALQVGREVVKVNRSTELCFGCIGDNRVCLAPRFLCSVVSHQKPKFSTLAPEPLLLIKQTSGKYKDTSAFTENVISTSLFDDDLTAYLLELEGKDLPSIFTLLEDEAITFTLMISSPRLKLPRLFESVFGKQPVPLKFLGGTKFKMYCLNLRLYKRKLLQSLTLPSLRRTLLDC